MDLSLVTVTLHLTVQYNTYRIVLTVTLIHLRCISTSMDNISVSILREDMIYRYVDNNFIVSTKYASYKAPCISMPLDINHKNYMKLFI